MKSQEIVDLYIKLENRKYKHIDRAARGLKSLLQEANPLSLATLHFHYGDKMRVSLHPFEADDVCDLIEIATEPALFLVSSSLIHVDQVNKLAKLITEYDRGQHENAN